MTATTTITTTTMIEDGDMMIKMGMRTDNAEDDESEDDEWTDTRRDIGDKDRIDGDNSRHGRRKGTQTSYE
jgi:hypothetical protein